ncbi:MAG: DUF2384 domain-containing protein [Candidatus Eremiobacteraeota bacterium]|nr:DUF2384 domain-containing protein [Candidatus Eremiobacteraeota bacterium]
MYEQVAAHGRADYNDMRAMLERGGFVRLESRRDSAHVLFRRGPEMISVPLSKPVNVSYIERVIDIVEEGSYIAEPHDEGSALEERDDPIRALARLYEGTSADADRAVRAGLPSITWGHLVQVGYTPQELAAIVGCSEEAIARKHDRREVLDVAEGDRTMRLVRITGDAIAAFGDPAKAVRWMRKPNRALSGERPIDAVVTEHGLSLVRRAVGVVAYGGVA